MNPRPLAPMSFYRLLTTLVVPRPIAWVSTVAPSGVRNLAPHSYFNICSDDPPIVHFTSSGEKDSLRNVAATKEFVINIVTEDLLEPMNLTSADFPPDEDEFAWAGLEAAPSVIVKPPRVAAAKAALECTLERVLQIGSGYMVFGDVVHIHVAPEVCRDGKPDGELLRPVGRLGGPMYAPIDRIIRIPRPRWRDLQQTPREAER
jgi:flavin reductase (DIM6/NTAB) family NADH-FMN oxidoreductase RutF